MSDFHVGRTVSIGRRDSVGHRGCDGAWGTGCDSVAGAQYCGLRWGETVHTCMGMMIYVALIFIFLILFYMCVCKYMCSYIYLNI